MTGTNRAALFMMALVVLGILGVGALPTGAHFTDQPVAAQATPTETASPLGTPTETPDGTPTATPFGTETPTETPVGTPAGTQAEEANVTFDDQTTAGDNVTVQSATLPEGGFVAIHAVNATMIDNGTATLDEINESALGAWFDASDYLEAGTQESVTVTLEPPIGEDQTLIAVAYQDSDGDQAFDRTIDEPYTVDGGLAADSANVTIEVGTPGGTATPAPGGTATPAPVGTPTPTTTPSP